MLANYAKDRNGVIFQIDKEPFNYDSRYISKAYGSAPVAEMSHLRLGYVLGTIGALPRSLLDVGYGSGDFLMAAKKIVPEVRGFDVPPAYPVEGVTIVDDMYDRDYDLVTFFDALEHFPDIYEIRRLKAKFVCVSLPWCHYFSDQWFETWKHRKPNEHLWHFDDASLPRFMADIGYECINLCNVEDTIRRSDGDWKNILTGVFRRRAG
jgi:hypothetical protein